MISYPPFAPDQLQFQVSALRDLAQIRDLYLQELIQQLNINRQLLANSFQLQPKQFPIASICQSKIEWKTSNDSLGQADSESSQMSAKKLKNKISHNSSLRNDTKNIPKNYGKAILTFVQRSPKSRKLAAEMGINFSEFMMQVRRVKKKVNSIESLRKMWGSQNLEHQIKKCIRILSYEFMRKHCLRYIFHSKVRNYGTHIKYRLKLIEGIQNPGEFNHIKDF